MDSWKTVHRRHETAFVFGRTAGVLRRLTTLQWDEKQEVSDATV
jgi:hypothetical protein